jgi:hypothetical protein
LGGISSRGGNFGSTIAGGAPGVPAANSGAGGVGGSAGAGIVAGSGGGAGATFWTAINNPAASYSYAVGAGGNGTAQGGGGGVAGGPGAAGIIIVREFYDGGAALSAVAPLPNYLGGLVLSNDTTTPNTVLDIATGAATSDDNAITMTLTAAFTKNCNAAFAAGSGNGALDSGSTLVASTWYHVFLISTGTVSDILVSTSATAPVFPPNYNKKRRIGSIKTNASAQIIAFSQVGNEFYWKSITTLDQSGASVPASPSVTLFATNVPTGINVIAIMNVVSVGSVAVWVVSFDQAISNINGWNVTAASTVFGAAQIRAKTNTSSQIAAAGNVAGATLNLVAVGWVDNRGK